MTQSRLSSKVWNLSILIESGETYIKFESLKVLFDSRPPNWGMGVQNMAHVITTIL